MAPKLVVIGSGWAGFYIAEKIDPRKYEVTIVSPRRTSAYTPLLASAACGVFNFYLAEDSVRSKSRKQIRFLKANVTGIDFDSKRCRCAPAFDEDDEQLPGFDLDYDILVIAPGCIPNTFGTPGVEAHAVMMKNVSDAMKIRKILFDLLEKASLPNTPVEKVKELLHIVVVGGGPTGIEMTAELDDLAHNELQDLYPGVGDKLSISIHDIAPNILSAYDKKLYEYANTQLVRRHIEVKTDSHIERVEKDCFYTKEDGRIGCGMLVWATGNKNVPLLDELDVRKTQKGLTRILTDSRLRVFSGKDEASLHEGVFALGDAADIDGAALPTTAEVALQKAKYLVEVFNSASSDPALHAPFRYQQKQLVSYLGGRDGVIAGKDDDHEGWTGRSAWLAWRGHNVLWNRNPRSRVMIILTWALNSIFGKRIAKI